MELLDDGELFQAHTLIWNHMFKYISGVSLKCAVQLGIPDVVHNHGRPMTLSELVDALPVNKTKAQGVYRLMRILIHSGIFVMQKISENDESEEGYWLTPASRLLLKDKPVTLTSLVFALDDPIYKTPFDHVTEWLQNDDPTPFYTTHGMTAIEYASVGKFADYFFDTMHNEGRLVTGAIFRNCKGIFEGLNSVVDVGCGTGIIAIEIAKAFPHLKCIAFDFPRVVARGEGTNNLSFVGGDMFEAIPPADAALLKVILTDWTDEECLRILKNCKEAIPSKDKGGKVIIIDIVLQKNPKEDDKLFEGQIFFDMFAMTYSKGKTRNEKELAKLFFDAGFSDYKITPILGVRSLIEVYP